MLIFAWFSYQILVAAKTKPVIVGLALLAPLSPLLLHVFAWDMHRWNTLVVTSAFLILYVVYAARGRHQEPELSRLLLPVLLFLICLNGMSEILLFDHYSVNQFPFVDQQQYWIDVLSGRAEFPAVPDH